jgi:hypothetical protein
LMRPGLRTFGTEVFLFAFDFTASAIPTFSPQFPALPIHP